MYWSIPNHDRDPGQKIYVVEILGYDHLVPFVTEADGLRYTQDDYPKFERGNQRLFQREAIVNRRMDAEEQDILDRLSEGSCARRPMPPTRLRWPVRQPAIPLTRRKRVNLRMTEP